MPSRDDLIDGLRSAAFSAGRAISTAECDAALTAAGGEYNGALLHLGLPAAAPAPAPVPAPAPAPAPTPKPVVAAKNPYQPTAARVAPVRIRNPQRILERRAFSSGLFDCGTSDDCGSCLAVVCCLPITTAQLFSK